MTGAVDRTFGRVARLQISNQAQHSVTLDVHRCTDFVAGAALFVNLEVQIS